MESEIQNEDGRRSIDQGKISPGDHSVNEHMISTSKDGGRAPGQSVCGGVDGVVELPNIRHPVVQSG